MALRSRRRRRNRALPPRIKAGPRKGQFRKRRRANPSRKRGAASRKSLATCYARVKRSAKARGAAAARKRRASADRERLVGPSRDNPRRRRSRRKSRKYYRPAAPGGFRRLKGRRNRRKAAGRWLALHGNPRRRRRARRPSRRRARRANPYLTRLNRRRGRRRARRRNPVYVFNRSRRRGRRRNPGLGGLGLGGLLSRVRALVNVNSIIDASYTLAGASVAISLPQALLGSRLDAIPGGAVARIVVSGVVGAGVSLLADRFLGRRAGEKVFQGVLIAEVAQALLYVGSAIGGAGIVNMLVPQFSAGVHGLGYLPYGYGNDALLSSEAGARGVGSWMELGMGQLPASSLSGMGDYASTYSPVAAVGPMAAPVGEAF